MPVEQQAVRAGVAGGGGSATAGSLGSVAARTSAPDPAPGVARRLKALIDGVWYDDLADTPELRRTLSGAGGGFHHRIGADGASAFPAAANRYHLYVSYACPWAHRTIIYRKLKRLEGAVSMSVLQPRWAGPGGWRFADEPTDASGGGGRRYLYEVYQAARPDYTGKVTVPVLWDRQSETIVNNESAEIIRMLNSAFDVWGDAAVDFYPAVLRREIDALNAWLVPNICAAVYRAGFADGQRAYERAVTALFDSLDELERRVARQPYLLGRRVTESDWHLFTTLCRFDAVYYGALKCNLRRLIDYPALSAYARRLHRLGGVAETVRMDHIKRHYYDAIGEIDATLVPRGPAVDYTAGARSRAAFGRGAAGGANPEPTAGRFADEVRELHGYLGDWLTGKAANAGRGPARLENALADDFIVIHPDGVREGKAAVLQTFAKAYGRKPAGYAVDIADISARLLGAGLGLVTYRESHRGEPGRARRSSALLRQRPGSTAIEWLFLQETRCA